LGGVQLELALLGLEKGLEINLEKGLGLSRVQVSGLDQVVGLVIELDQEAW
jgi:hypothetical protein